MTARFRWIPSTLVIATVFRKRSATFPAKASMFRWHLSSLECRSKASAWAIQMEKQRISSSKEIWMQSLSPSPEMSVSISSCLKHLRAAWRNSTKRALLYIPKLPWMLFALSKMFCPQHRCWSSAAVCLRAFLTISTMNWAKAHRNMMCPLFWTHRVRCSWTEWRRLLFWLNPTKKNIMPLLAFIPVWRRSSAQAIVKSSWSTTSPTAQFLLAKRVRCWSRRRLHGIQNLSRWM